MNTMRSGWLIVTLLLLTYNTLLQAQEIRNSGYILFNDGSQEAVIFEEQVLYDNPTKILYKSSAENTIKAADISDVQEFWMPGVFKYVRHIVDIDRSGDKSINITATRSPIFNQETLFLQVLIEGENSLYMYRDGDLIRFFYRIGEDEVKQFVYKVYLAKVDVLGRLEDKPRLNETYKQQVINELKCEDITIELAQELQYRKGDFVRVFKKYNHCLGVPYTEWKGQKPSRLMFNIKVRSGIRNTLPHFNPPTAVTIRNTLRLPVPQTEIQSEETNFFIGGEFEVLIPLMSTGISSFFVELAYLNYETDLVGSDAERYDMSLDFHMISSNIGFRYYYPVTERLSPFLDLGIGVTTIVNESTSVTTNRGSGQFENISHPLEGILGAGFTINDRIDLLARYGRALSSDSESIGFRYASLSLSYNLF